MNMTAKDTVTITFNGQDRPLAYQPEATVEALLVHAKEAFGVQSNHLLSLFTEGGVELPDKESAEKAGITPGMLLVLRQSTVKGGGMTALALEKEVLTDTFSWLRRCGAGVQECVVYWCGPVAEPGVVDAVVHPTHTATPHGYEVESDWVNTFFLDLRRAGTTVRAQVHSHPGPAGHSSTDDAFALAPATGFLSLVIPNFGLGEVCLDGAHLVVMDPDGSWRELDAAEELSIGD